MSSEIHEYVLKKRLILVSTYFQMQRLLSVLPMALPSKNFSTFLEFLNNFLCGDGNEGNNIRSYLPLKMSSDGFDHLFFRSFFNGYSQLFQCKLLNQVIQDKLSMSFLSSDLLNSIAANLSITVDGSLFQATLSPLSESLLATMFSLALSLGFQVRVFTIDFIFMLMETRSAKGHY